MRILVTDAAGFIGSTLALRLLACGNTVIGIDNHNKYYDPSIKEARLACFASNPNYTHLRIDIADRKTVEQAFKEYQPQRVVNLAAQAGVRYSIENRLAYIVRIAIIDIGYLGLPLSLKFGKVRPWSSALASSEASLMNLDPATTAPAKSNSQPATSTHRQPRRYPSLERLHRNHRNPSGSPFGRG